MRLYWLQDRVKNKEFKVYWSQGKNNLADYYTKHFSPTYHQQVRPTYILKGHNMSTTEQYGKGVLIPYIVSQNITPWGTQYSSP